MSLKQESINLITSLSKKDVCNVFSLLYIKECKEMNITAETLFEKHVRINTCLGVSNILLNHCISK